MDTARTLADVIVRARRAATDAPADAVVNLGAIGTTVRCNDTPWDEPPAYYSQVADRQTARYPFFGYLNGVPMCAYWPQGRDSHAPLAAADDAYGSHRR